MIFLEFEQEIAELYEELDKIQAINQKGKINLEVSIHDLESKIEGVRKKTYKNLSGWQKVQVSRHVERPYTLHYIENMCDKFIELHGDRNVGDDKAIVSGLGTLGNQNVLIVGHQKGVNTKMRQYRNFGMANPEGYRKANRLMKMAEKFNVPIVCLIDTPGAFPGILAEERGQAEAIAKNIQDMFRLKVPIVCIVIGEGASGGAIGIGVGDRVLMLENTWYSVISPESCSSILWRSWDYKEQAAEQLKLTPKDMLNNKLIDGIIPEPIGGAHTDPKAMADNLKKAILKNIKAIQKDSIETMLEKRIEKFSQMGVFQE